MAGNGELHLGSGRGAAPYVEFSADSLCAFAHAGQAPMSFPSGQQQLRIDSAPIVAHHHSELAGRVFELNLDALGARVLESIDQRFAADAINLVTQHWVQGSRLAIHDNSKSNVVLAGEFFLDARKSLFQI